jgi:glycosyltransferase involved in cell wall biosynthesis
MPWKVAGAAGIARRRSAGALSCYPLTRLRPARLKLPGRRMCDVPFLWRDHRKFVGHGHSEAWSWNAKHLTLLLAGKLIPLKGLALALESLARSNRIYPFVLQVAGGGGTTAERMIRCRATGHTRSREFLGAMPGMKLQRVYQNRRLHIHEPARFSANILLEAMAHALRPRRSIIRRRRHGARRRRHKSPGRIIRRAVEALAAGIRLLAEAPETRQRLGQAVGHMPRHTAGPNASNRFCVGMLKSSRIPAPLDDVVYAEP